MNHVIFTQQQASQDLTVYSKTLGDFSWRRTLVGLTDLGFLYVDERVARKGCYEYYPKLLPWKDVQAVAASRCISFRGILFGATAMFIGFCAFVAGWIKSTHIGPGVITIPFFGTIGGAMYTFGALRNRIVVQSTLGTFKWRSLPLTYRKTLSICEEAAEKARAHQVPTVASHVLATLGRTDRLAPLAWHPLQTAKTRVLRDWREF